MRRRSGPLAFSLRTLCQRCVARSSDGLEFKVVPEHFRALVLERMRLPLQIVEARCECGAALDVQGRHRAACPSP